MDVFVEHGEGAQFAAPGADPRHRLFVRLFGRLEVCDSLGCSIVPNTRRTRAILAVLALNAPKSIDRKWLASSLWSNRDPEQARGSLRQCLHDLKTAMAKIGENFLHAERDSVMLRAEEIWVDAAISQTATIATIDRLNIARGPLMGDLLGIDPALDRWIKDQQTRIAETLKATAQAFLAAGAGSADTIAVLERLLQIDPTNEGAWRSLMSAHSSIGDHAAAINVYHRCTSTLTEKVGISPSNKTVALFKRVRRVPVGMAGEAKPSHDVKKRLLAKYNTIRLGLIPIRALNPRAREFAEILTSDINVSFFRFRDFSCRIMQHMHLGQVADSKFAAEIDYVLDGTVYADRGVLVVVVSLLDCLIGGEVIWSEKFQHSQGESLLPEAVSSAVAAQAHAAMSLNESRRLQAEKFPDLTAHQMILRAIPAVCRLQKQDFLKAGALLSSAVKRDPNYATGCAWWAYWNLLLIGQGWAKDSDAAVAKTAELTQRAILLNPQDGHALTLIGHVLAFTHRRLEDGLALHERALRINPGLSLAWLFSGLAHTYAGSHAEGARRILHGQQLCPIDPQGFFFDMGLTLSYMLSGEVGLAVLAGRLASNNNPGFSSTFKAWTSALGLCKETTERAVALRHLLRLEPRLTVGATLLRSPLARLEDRQRFAEGLRLAGLPE